MVSFVIPGYNNLRHLKNCYESVKKHAPDCEMIIIDDGSTDGTWEWARLLMDPNVLAIRFDERRGHTIRYDFGISKAKHDIVGILHCDMIIGPNYVQNMLKHLKPKTVVCGTRVEPPIHPHGREKIIMDFGMDFHDLRTSDFDAFCKRTQEANANHTTKGMFAPWILYKEDFDYVGGHDPLFAPFPYEDSDIFQRWMLAGYDMVQSRDALVYHLTCRGHRFTEEIGKDDEYYKVVSRKAARNYVRKWGSWIQNDEYQLPIMSPKYNVAFVINSRLSPLALEYFEPWCDALYVTDDTHVKEYILKEQPNTKYDLSSRIRKHIDWREASEDIVVSMDSYLEEGASYVIENLAKVLEDAEVGETYAVFNMKIRVNNKRDRRNELIFITKES
ncbi:MAG: glycosyltransferase [Proteobacteria bacterium]|nr:glycosyltransferase [Pseudomonadota bacterium]